MMSDDNKADFVAVSLDTIDPPAAAPTAEAEAAPPGRRPANEIQTVEVVQTDDSLSW